MSVTEEVARAVTGIARDAALERLFADEREQAREAKRKLQRRNIEMARALAGADAGSGDATPGGEGTEDGGSDPGVIEEMMDDEDCPVCESILGAVAEMDEPRRTRGVAEYGEFRRAVDEGEEAAQAVMEDSDILQDAVRAVKGL